MRAVVLAAGKGTRLGALTDALPKPMLPLNGQPLIHYTLSRLVDAGVSDVFINLHHCPDVLRSYCSTGERWGLNITYVHEPVRELTRHLESAPFYVLYGDNYFECDLADLAASQRATGALATIGLVEREDVATSGIVGVDDDGRIRRFKEKPSPDEAFSHLVNAGVYVLSPAIFTLMPAVTPCDFGHDVFPALLAAGERLYGVVTGPVWASDTPELYRALLAHVQHAS